MAKFRRGRGRVKGNSRRHARQISQMVGDRL